jgi:hypothetical protein
MTAIDLEMPHTVYVVVAKDRRGFKRGFEKVSGERFFIDYRDALNALRALPVCLHDNYMIGEAVIGWPKDNN